MFQSAQDAVLINPASANVVLPQEVYALRAAGAGNIAVITRAGNTVVLAFAAGETRYIYTSEVLSTANGTTATGIDGFISANALANANYIKTDADPSVPPSQTVWKGNADVAPASDGSDNPTADDTSPMQG